MWDFKWAQHLPRHHAAAIESNVCQWQCQQRQQQYTTTRIYFIHNDFRHHIHGAEQRQLSNAINSSRLTFGRSFASFAFYYFFFILLFSRVHTRTLSHTAYSTQALPLTHKHTHTRRTARINVIIRLECIWPSRWTAGTWPSNAHSVDYRPAHTHTKITDCSVAGVLAERSEDTQIQWDREKGSKNGNYSDHVFISFFNFSIRIFCSSFFLAVVVFALIFFYFEFLSPRNVLSGGADGFEM